jgi:hypothetical protein
VSSATVELRIDWKKNLKKKRVDWVGFSDNSYMIMSLNTINIYAKTEAVVYVCKYIFKENSQINITCN